MLVTPLNPPPWAEPSADSVGQRLSELQLHPCSELRLWIFAPCTDLMAIWAIFCPPGQQCIKALGPTDNRHHWSLRGEEDDLHQLNVNTWWVDLRPLRAGVMQSDVSDESVPWHSRYQTVRRLTKKAFKCISNNGMKPRCLASITPIKNSQRWKPVQLSAWAHSKVCFFFSRPHCYRLIVQHLPLHGRHGLWFW